MEPNIEANPGTLIFYSDEDVIHQILALLAVAAIPNLQRSRSITQEGDGLICCKAEVGTNIECRGSVEVCNTLAFCWNHYMLYTSREDFISIKT